MDFIVLEIQTVTTGNTSVLHTVFPDRATAEQKYHQILSYAAVSTVAIHSAVMLASDGRMLKTESYTHTQPEPETEE